MNFFDLLQCLLYTKKVKELNAEDLTNLSTFMISRWLSFYDKSRCEFVNDTLNRFTPFDNKADQYSFLYNFIPKLTYKRINYIKKKKIETEEIKNNREFFSKREHQMYLDFLKSTTN